jgi:valyl-tRNA synthetase
LLPNVFLRGETAEGGFFRSLLDGNIKYTKEWVEGMMNKDILPKAYEPSIVEQKWYQFWTENKLFHANEKSEAPSYSIVIPPPNVTGSLHMGHALNNTLQDILCRYKRMKGFNVLWMPGTDHAGIATQNVVEKQLATEGLTRQQLGRRNFIERVWEWREEYGRTSSKRRPER